VSLEKGANPVQLAPNPFNCPGGSGRLLGPGGEKPVKLRPGGKSQFSHSNDSFGKRGGFRAHPPRLGDSDEEGPRSSQSTGRAGRTGESQVVRGPPRDRAFSSFILQGQEARLHGLTRGSGQVIEG